MKVRIETGDYPGLHRVFLDDKDVSDSTVAINARFTPGGLAVVSIEFTPDELTLDLDDAKVEGIRAVMVG